MNIGLNATQWVSDLLNECRYLSISAVDQQIMIIGTSILGLCVACSWAYRTSLKEKNMTEEHNPQTKEVDEIGQDILNDRKESDSFEQTPFFLSQPLTKQIVINKAQMLKLQLDGVVFPKRSIGKQNALELVTNLYTEEIILKTLENTQILIHPSVEVLIDRFLRYKSRFGSEIEQQLYLNLSRPAFIARLLTTPSPIFKDSKTSPLVRNGKKSVEGFESTELDKESELQLTDCLSYDEMEILALIGISIPTHFINDGNYLNQGLLDLSSNYEKEGLCLGLVGPSLEREGFMEYQSIMVSWIQNRPEKGYGPLPEREEDDNAITGKMRLFTEFYKIDYFPTYEEIQKLNSEEVTEIDFFECDEGFIRKDIYQERMKILIEIFLSKANEQAGKTRQKAYAQPCGWGFCKQLKYDIQHQWFIEVFFEVIRKNTYPHVADIDFSFFMKLENYSRSLEKFIQKNGETLNGIKLHFPSPAKSREPCAKLRGSDAGKLLVNSYESSGNAYCRNEHWRGLPTSSTETAIIGASPLLFFAQLPEINPYLTDTQKTQKLDFRTSESSLD